jgi:hypothetical protein
MYKSLTSTGSKPGISHPFLSMREKTGIRLQKSKTVEVEWTEHYTLRGRKDRMKIVASPRKKARMTPSTPAVHYQQEFPSYDEPLEPIKLPKACIYILNRTWD